VMAEIRREILRKISTRLKKEQVETTLLKESAPQQRMN
jgi:hypothetical protein